MVSIRRIGLAKRRLIVAALAGVTAAALMFFYAESLKAQASSAQRAALEEYGGTRTEVLVATRDILAGEELQADNTALMPWLADLLPAGSITDPSEAYGQTLAYPVWSNEPILSARLGGGNELIRVPDGLSAVSIPIRDDMAVGGSLFSGSSVDVYAIGATKVHLVLSDVLVLEASNSTHGEHGSSSEEAGVVLGGGARATLKWVTLAVSDETVTELLHAARDNTLCLVLPGQDARVSQNHSSEEARETHSGDVDSSDNAQDTEGQNQ